MSASSETVHIGTIIAYGIIYAMFVEDAQFYKFILDSGLVGREDLDRAKAEAEQKNKRLGDILLENGKINQDNLRRMQAYVLGIPFVDLKGTKIPFDTLSLIPEPIARGHNIVAIKKDNTSLEVAMLDVNDLSAIDFIKKKVSLKILPRLTDTESIKEALVQYQKSLKAEFGDIIQKETASLTVYSDDKKEPAEEDLKKIAEDLPVIRIVDTLIKHAILQNASDIHIEPMEDQVLYVYQMRSAK
jgi:type IV pilus assembly protein PilB